MPSTIPLYIPILTSMFAIGIVKHTFGGLGQNWANPAMTGIVFALFSWSKQMNLFNTPFINDSIPASTPLVMVKNGLIDNFGINHISTLISSGFTGPMDFLQDTSYLKLFFGFKSGYIGEISIFLILISAIYLIYRKIILSEIPFFYIGTTLLLIWIFDGLKYNQGFFKGDPLFHLLTGALVFGAFFCASDPVTTPITTFGRIIFGVGCGVITSIIRMFGGLSEGVALSILFMNMLSPAIDKIIPTKFIKKTNNNKKD
jgi:electron transport complex protein RnfD